MPSHVFVLASGPLSVQARCVQSSFKQKHTVWQAAVRDSALYQAAPSPYLREFSGQQEDWMRIPMMSITHSEPMAITGGA